MVVVVDYGVVTNLSAKVNNDTLLCCSSATFYVNKSWIQFCNQRTYHTVQGIRNIGRAGGSSKKVEGNGNLGKTKKSRPVMLATVQQ